MTKPESSLGIEGAVTQSQPVFGSVPLPTREAEEPAAFQLASPAVNAIPLAEWMPRMAKLAGYDTAEAMIADTGADCWMDFYNQGYTPGEAWAEECSDG